MCINGVVEEVFYYCGPCPNTSYIGRNISNSWSVVFIIGKLQKIIELLTEKSLQIICTLID